MSSMSSPAGWRRDAKSGEMAEYSICVIEAKKKDLLTTVRREATSKRLPEEGSLHWLPGLEQHASLVRNPLPYEQFSVGASLSSCSQI